MGPKLADPFPVSHRQNELKEGAQRSVGRQYFYVDYKRLCNVVKWRVAEMHRVIDTGLRNVSPLPNIQYLSIINLNLTPATRQQRIYMPTM